MKLQEIAELLPRYYVNVSYRASDNADSISIGYISVVEVRDMISPLHLAKILHEELNLSYSEKMGGYAQMRKDNPYYFSLGSSAPNHFSEYTGFADSVSSTYSINLVIVIDYNKLTNEVNVLTSFKNEDGKAYKFSELIKSEIRKDNEKKAELKRINDAMSLFTQLDKESKKKALESIKEEQ